MIVVFTLDSDLGSHKHFIQFLSHRPSNKARILTTRNGLQPELPIIRFWFDVVAFANAENVKP